MYIYVCLWACSEENLLLPPQDRLVYYVKAGCNLEEDNCCLTTFFCPIRREEKHCSTIQFSEQRQLLALSPGGSFPGRFSLSCFAALWEWFWTINSFPISCPNPHKLLYFSSFVCFSLRWESPLSLFVWNTPCVKIKKLKKWSFLDLWVLHHLRAHRELWFSL